MRISWTALALLPAGLLAQSAGVYTVDVPPEPGESFAEACRFELTIPAAEYSTRAVWVIYDRGRDTRAFYDDEQLFQFAERRHLGLLWARHCPAKETGETDPDPSHGAGRALLTALNRLQRPSGHGELSTSKIIVLGSGDDAALTARMAQFAPERFMAAIVHAPTGFEKLQSPPNVPQLVIANAADPAAGTKHPFGYFQRHLTNGAPWVFAVQQSDEGALSASKPLLFAWIEGLLDTIPDTNAPVSMGALQRSGWWLFLRMQDSGEKDDSGQPLTLAADARIAKVGQSPPSGYQHAGWVPSKKMAEAWQNFIRRGR
jgi:hypothetical protein